MFLITIPSSENHDWLWSNGGDRAEQKFKSAFPPVYRHFLPHRAALQKRQDQGRYWWELRSCDYMDQFNCGKVIWQEMAWFTRFSFDTEGHVILNTAYMLVTDDPIIPACLNSPVAWWYMWRTAQHGKDEVLRLIRDYTEQFPIPDVDGQLRSRIGECVQELTAVVTACRKMEGGFIREIATLMGLGNIDEEASDWLMLSREAFLRKAERAAGDRSSAEVSHRLGALYDGSHEPRVRAMTSQLEIERRLATLVEEAYGLTVEERQLLRQTRPPRDPIDVLQAKIAGKPASAPRADWAT